MFANAVDVFMYFLPLILAFFAGALSMFALWQTLVHLDEVEAGRQLAMQRHPSSRMELDEDEEHIQHALRIGNS
jgi:hypothetical protein